MHRQKAELFSKLLIVFDVLISGAAFWVALGVRQWLAASGFEVDAPFVTSPLQVPQVGQPEQYSMLMVVLVPVWAVALYSSATHDFRASYNKTVIRYARAVGLGLAAIVVLQFLFKLHFLARSFVLLFGLVQFSALGAGRVLLMETITSMRRKRVDGHRVVVVGCGPKAAQLAASLRSQGYWNVKLLGHVVIDDEVCDATTTDSILGRLHDLPELLDNQPVDEVIFAIPGLTPDAFADAVNACDERGVDVLLPLPPSLPPRAQVELATLEGFDAPLLGLRRTPSDELALVMKRGLDIVGSAALLVVTAPVMLAAAVATKVTSPGPVLFQQVRAGRNGRKFVMYKFRSMVVDAEAQKAKLRHLNEMDGPVFKIRKDPRVTRVGAFLRRTSIDELPQLFNILLGDMSLVGPRPPIPSEVEQYKPWQRRRLSVKPGLTGLWQVSGRNEVDFEEWMQLDLRYIDDWSLWLDIKILIRTVPAVLFKTGAS